MAKRLLMVMLFVGAIGAASLVAPKSAEARGCGPRGYHSFGYAPVYRSNFYHGGFYAPRSAFYGPSFYHQRSFYRGGGFGLHRGGLYIGW